MKKNNWQLLNFQFVIALKNSIGNSVNALKKLENHFDVNPMVLPIPDTAPKEIPRIVVSSKDFFKLEISNERMNLIFEDQELDNESSKKSYKEIKDQLKNKVGKILELLSPEIFWVGLILRNVNRNSEANENMQKFLNEKGLSIFSLGSKENDLLIKFHEKIDLELGQDKYKSDLNVEIGSTIRKIENNEQIGNLLILDMNTRKSQEKKHDLEIINSFVEQVFKKQEDFFIKMEL